MVTVHDAAARVGRLMIGREPPRTTSIGFRPADTCAPARTAA
jgi:hypothetical protein